MGSLRPPKADREEIAAQKKLAKKVQTTSVGAWMVCKFYPGRLDRAREHPEVVAKKRNSIET